MRSSRKSVAARPSAASSAVKPSSSSAIKASATKRISSAVKSSASKPLTLSSALKASSALKRTSRQSSVRPKSPVQKINYSDLDKENEIHLVPNPFQTKAKLEHTPGIFLTHSIYNLTHFIFVVKCSNKVVITASEANTPNSTDQTVLVTSSKKGTPLESTMTMDTTWKLEEQLLDDNNTSIFLGDNVLDVSSDEFALKTSSTFVAAGEPIIMINEVDSTEEVAGLHTVVLNEQNTSEKNEVPVVTSAPEVPSAPVTSCNKVELSSIDNLISNIESVLSEYSNCVNKNVVPTETIAVIEADVDAAVVAEPIKLAVTDEMVTVEPMSEVLPVVNNSGNNGNNDDIEPLHHTEVTKAPSPVKFIPVVTTATTVSHDEVSKRRMSIEDLLLAFREDAEAAESAMYHAASSGRLLPNEFRDYIKAFRSPPKTSNINLQIPTSLAMKFVELVVSPHRMTQASSRVKSATKSIASIRKEKNTSVKSKGKQGAMYVRSSIGTMDLNGDMVDTENPFIAKKALQHSPVTGKNQVVSSVPSVPEPVAEVSNTVTEAVVLPDISVENVEFPLPVVREIASSNLLTSMISSSEFAPVITNHKSPRNVAVSPIFAVHKEVESVPEQVTVVVPSVTIAPQVETFDTSSVDPRRQSGSQWSEQELDRVSQAVRRISLDQAVMATLPSGLMDQFQSEIEKLRLEVVEQKGQFVVERELLMSRLGDVEGKLLAASHKIEEVIEEATRRIEDHERVRLQSDCMLVKNDINRIDEALVAICQRRRARSLLQQQLDDEIAQYCFDVPPRTLEEPVEHITATLPRTITHPSVSNTVPMVSISKEQFTNEYQDYDIGHVDDFDNYDVDNGLDASMTVDAPAPIVAAPSPVIIKREKKSKPPKAHYVTDDDDVDPVPNLGNKYGNLYFVPLSGMDSVSGMNPRTKQEKKLKSTSQFMNFSNEGDYPESRTSDVIVQMSKVDTKAAAKAAKGRTTKAAVAVSDTEKELPVKASKGKKSKATVSDTEVDGVGAASTAKGRRTKASIGGVEHDRDSKATKTKKTTSKEEIGHEVAPDAVTVPSTLTLVPLSNAKPGKKTKAMQVEEPVPASEKDIVSNEAAATGEGKADQGGAAGIADEKTARANRTESRKAARGKVAEAPTTASADSKSAIEEVAEAPTTASATAETAIAPSKRTDAKKRKAKSITIPQLFIESMKSEILATNPKESAGIIASRLESMWLQLSETDKLQWTELDIESQNGVTLNEPGLRKKKSKSSNPDTETTQKSKASKKQAKENMVVEIAAVTSQEPATDNKKQQASKSSRKGVKESPQPVEAIIPSIDALSPVKGSMEMNDISTTDIDADFLIEPAKNSYVSTKKATSSKKRAMLEPVEEMEGNKRPKADAAPAIGRTTIDTSNSSMNSTSISQIITKSSKFVIPKLKVKK